MFQESRQLFRIGAQAQDKVHILLGSKLFEHVHDRLSVRQFGVAELQERVNEDGADVKVGGKDTAQEADGGAADPQESGEGEKKDTPEE